MLHVTNGDSVVNGFRDGALPGEYLPWRDVLHDGPVPQTSSLESLSDIRAEFIADGRGLARAGVRAGFAERDRTLASFRSHDETVLWFEHDLYDQLQLIQILDWFSGQDLAGVRLSLIQIDRHPDVVPFYGLGQLNGRQLRDLLPARVPVTARHIESGREAWAAFCAPDPALLPSMASRAIPDLPFLPRALHRFLEEYPSMRNGLSRTERQLLTVGAAGARHRHDFYRQSQALEPWPWGDSSVYDRLERLAAGEDRALDSVGGDEFAINEHGRRLLAGDADWRRSRSSTDIWLGGVHLSGPGGWRWSEDEGTVTWRDHRDS